MLQTEKLFAHSEWSKKIECGTADTLHNERHVDDVVQVALSH